MGVTRVKSDRLGGRERDKSESEEALVGPQFCGFVVLWFCGFVVFGFWFLIFHLFDFPTIFLLFLIYF